MAGPVVARVLVLSGPSARPQPTIAPPSPPAPTRKDARGSPTPVAPPHYPGAPVLKSPFGGDLVSDKSLDDVILTYLAEEFLDDAQDDKGSDGGAP